MKRKLALFMVLALIVSMMPAAVFASSSNEMITTPTITDDQTYTPKDDEVPYLRIEESNPGDFDATSETFSLTLTNGDWDSETDDYDFEDEMADQILASIADNYGSTTATVTASVEVDRVSDSRIDVTIDLDASTSKELVMKIPVAFDADDEGEVEITIDGKNTPISDETLTVAYVADGESTITIDDTTDFSDESLIEDILIEELVMNTFADGEILQLKLTDSDMTWDLTSVSISASGEWSGTFTEETVEDEDELVASNSYGAEDNYFWVKLGLDDDGYDDTGAITISGLAVDPGDADFGDVNVKFTSDNGTEETITVGTYTDYEVTVEADEDDDIPTLYSGMIGDDVEVDGADYDTITDDGIEYNGSTDTEFAATLNGDDEVVELATLVIDETVANSWLSSRTTEIDFPSWVKIIDVVVETDSDNVSESDLQDELDEEIQGSNPSDVSFSIDKTDNDDTTDIWLTFYVSVEAGAEGDIIATVGGSSLEDDTEVKLGEAVAPVTVEVEVEDVRLGLQDQAVGTVTITEAEAGLIESGRYIVLSIENEIEFSSTPEVEVIEGDLTIDDVDKEDDKIIIKIDDESTEASTIQISGIEVDVDRTVEEGAFDIDIQGNAIVQNYSEEGDDFRFDTSSQVSTTFVNVITPADADVKAAETVSFTIDAMEYKIGDTVVTMDVAPYIDSANRTMLPLRAFANALGVADADILWNGTERSVTIFKGDAVVKVVIGEMAFMKNGVSVPMDTMAVIKDGRTFLPVRALGQALGADIGWDAATRTVTID